MTRQESTQEYIARVGSAFAIAVARAESRKLSAKLEAVKASEKRLAAAAEAHCSYEDETALEVAFETYKQELEAKIKGYQAMESEAFRLDLPGTNPGTQDGLTGNGIDIDLEAVRADVERSRRIDD